MRRAAFVTSLFAVATAAHAADGVFEINQTCAVTTGCFAGDAAGFPVTITSPGSYRLTSNLQVSTPAGGIEAQTRGVMLDLGGFQIAGLGSCTGSGSSLACSGGVSVGVTLLATESRVANGTVRGFQTGIIGNAIRVDDVVSRENTSNGYFVSTAIVSTSVANRNGQDGFFGSGTFRDSSARENGGRGFAVEIAQLLGVQANTNGGDGIVLVSQGIVRDSTSVQNGGRGIVAASSGTFQDGSVVESNLVLQNHSDGIVASRGTLVSRNVARHNTLAGIAALSSSSVVGNTSTSNGTFGLYLFPENGGTAAAYRDNFVAGNTLGTVVSGVNMGGNSCNGTTTCP